MSCPGKSSVLCHCSRTECQTASFNPKRWITWQPAASSSPLQFVFSIATLQPGGLPFSALCLSQSTCSTAAALLLRKLSPLPMAPLPHPSSFNLQAICHLLREISVAASDQVLLLYALLASIYFFIFCCSHSTPAEYKFHGSKDLTCSLPFTQSSSCVEWVNHNLPVSVTLHP